MSRSVAGAALNIAVAVRALCEFSAKRGDLDLRFTPAPSALEGMAGHQAVTAKRGSAYEKEISLQATYRNLTVRGRADGYDPERRRVEEIKTLRGAVERIPDNHRALHWAQAKLYAHMICRQRGMSDVRIALIYYNVDDQRETALEIRATARELAEHFDKLCDQYLQWGLREKAHRDCRDQAMRGLAFPFEGFRAGQRELAAAVFRAARDARSLMAQAPTGIGKTLATLFPLLKSFPQAGIDKLFFLTAKTPGRQVALDALRRLASIPERSADPANAANEAKVFPLRILELTARDKACEHPDKACHGDSCPLATGFYDRLPAARAAAADHTLLTRDALRDIGLHHEVCPYYLAQEMSLWSDVIVGDYNYYYDVSAVLYSQTQQRQWQVGILVDEAHNLLERGRDMYTSTLRYAGLVLARKNAPAALKRALTTLARRWGDLAGGGHPDFQVLPEPPSEFISACRDAAGVIGGHVTDAPMPQSHPLLRFYFDLYFFLKLAENFGAHSLFDISKDQSGGPSLCIRNVTPAPFLACRHKAARTCAFFSGTMSPERYYRDMLGIPDQAAWLDISSPFHRDQLKVRIATRISTRFTDRLGSLPKLGKLIAQVYRQTPGNYLCFVSSFEYLKLVAAELHDQAADIPVWRQHAGMSESDRQQFLDRFTADGRGVGLAVLGGAFAEGVDLPGKRLIGAFIATLGLPQINPVNEAMRTVMQNHFGQGYDYAYLYPGLRKVVQAAGRVIRTERDTGVIYLLDDRYAKRTVRKLLPAWWNVTLLAPD